MVDESTLPYARVNEMNKFMTALDLAIALGAKPSVGGSYTYGELAKYNTPLMGGCVGCEASIACYNAYPSKSGYWKCEDCIDEGFTSIREYQNSLKSTE